MLLENALPILFSAWTFTWVLNVLKVSSAQVIWAMLCPGGGSDGRGGRLGVTGLSLRPAIVRILFMKMEVVTKMLFNQHQAVQMFLTPKDLLGKNKRELG